MQVKTAKTCDIVDKTLFLLIIAVRNTVFLHFLANFK